MYPAYSEPLGKAMSLCIQNRFSELKGSDFLVPVPKHPEEIVNGCNQAEKLTDVVSSILELPAINVLTKVGPVKMKSLTSRSSRKESVKGLYEVHNSAPLENKQAILIDDVTTSGSTASECAQVLLNIGAKMINVVVAGRDVFVD